MSCSNPTRRMERSCSKVSERAQASRGGRPRGCLDRRRTGLPERVRRRLFGFTIIIHSDSKGDADPSLLDYHVSVMVVAGGGVMRVSWKQRLWGFTLAAAGVAIFASDRTVSHAMFMCASLLIGWTQAFEPGPSARMPLRDVFDGYRTGRIRPTTLTQKLVTVAGMLLLVATFIAALKGL